MRCCLFGDYVSYIIIRQIDAYILIAFIVRLCFFSLLITAHLYSTGRVSRWESLPHKQCYS